MVLKKPWFLAFLDRLNIVFFAFYCALSMAASVVYVLYSGEIERLDDRPEWTQLYVSDPNAAQLAELTSWVERESTKNMVNAAALAIPSALLVAPAVYMAVVNGVLRWLFTGHFSLSFRPQKESDEN